MEEAALRAQMLAQLADKDRIDQLSAAARRAKHATPVSLSTAPLNK